MKSHIAWCGALAAAVAVQAQTCERTKVAILGGGVAGITAAQSLSNHSVTDFIIVEFQNRLGGRMRDVQFGAGKKYTIEAGANWVQGLGSEGGPQNPIYSLALKYNLTTLVTDAENLTMYDENGVTDYKEYVDNFSEAMARTEVDAGSLLMNNFQDRTFRAGLRVQDWDPAKYDAYSQVAEWFSFDGEYAFTPEESSQIFTSVAENATFKYFSDENLFSYDQRGFGVIIRNEAATFLEENDPRVKLNTLVTAVEYTNNSVTVTTDEGCIEADYAIMTFSVGVLQRGRVEFSPELPAWKKSAIASFEMGTYTKIFLQFEDRWWDNAQFMLYADPSERGHYPQFQPLDLPGVLEGSGIVIATVVNKQSYQVESQSEAETQAEIMEVIRKMAGRNVSDPVSIWYPRWSQTPWAYGSFSNWPPSTSLQAHQNFRTNVGNLFFAGEATSQEFFGYLHGAYFEGKHVGTFLANCLNNGTTCQVSDNHVRYPVLSGVTPYNMYNWENGWYVDTFA